MAKSLTQALSPLSARPSRTREALELIRAAILSGELMPDSRHSVASLAESLAVSRTPVREALIELAASGMVRFERNRGVRILATTLDEIREIFEIRQLLEVPAARKSVRQMTPQRRDTLRRHLAQIEKAAEMGDEARLWQADRAFHRELLYGGGNSRLADYVDSLRDMVLTKGVTTAGKSRSLHEIAAEHRRIFDRVDAGDEEETAAQLNAHLVRTAELLLAQEGGTDHDGS